MSQAFDDAYILHYVYSLLNDVKALIYAFMLSNMLS